jgi:hypothetical protein
MTSRRHTVEVNFTDLITRSVHVLAAQNGVSGRATHVR